MVEVVFNLYTSGIPSDFTIEFFIPWIHNFILSFQGQKDNKYSKFISVNTKYLKSI